MDKMVEISLWESWLGSGGSEVKGIEGADGVNSFHCLHSGAHRVWSGTLLQSNFVKVINEHLNLTGHKT